MAYQDLLKDTTAPDPSDKDAFLVTVVDLNPDKVYPLQFRWKYKDGSYGQDWSPSYDIYTGDEQVVLKPYFPITNVDGGSGYISVTWDGRDSDLVDMEWFDRVDILIKDHSSNAKAVFGDGTKAAAFFKSKGTKTITAPAGKYIVKLRTVGKSGKFSDSVPAGANDYLVTVTSGLTIEDPTLPDGLSVSVVPFGVAVNWSGGYSAASFFGFQSINIYASTTNYGATTSATNITNSKLVGAMTVNDSANKITVGLDALRSALGLALNKDCYTTDTYFYYIATNLNGVKYKVNGAEVYTLISATPIRPEKANFIDLENGVISIENLVAGNGQFQSWLRAGTAGSARIELSATTVLSQDAGGYQVLPGFTVYDSSNSPAFRADFLGNVSIGGYTKGDFDLIKQKGNENADALLTVAEAAHTAADLASTKNKIFRTTDGSTPTAVAAGDVWVNGADGNKMYVSTAAGTSSWVLSTNAQITEALGKIVGFNSNGTLFNKDLQLQAGAGSIYSNKSAYSNDSDNGWYLGYIPNTTSAALALGSSSTGLIKWDPSAGLRLTGDISSTANITGGTVKATGSYGSIKLSSSTESTIDFLSTSSAVVAQMRTYDSGSSFVIHYGSGRYNGFDSVPASTAVIQMSSTTMSAGRVNSSGVLNAGFISSQNGQTVLAGYWTAPDTNLSTTSLKNIIAQSTQPSVTLTGTVWLQV
jgi:hypothetical protein